MKFLETISNVYSVKLVPWGKLLLCSVVLVAALVDSAVFAEGAARGENGSHESKADNPFQGTHQGTSVLGKELYSLPRNPDSDVSDRRYDPFLIANQQLIDDPDNPENKITLGVAHALSWRFREAINVYNKAIGEHPDYAPLFRYRGHRQITLRRFDLAIDDLKHAVEQDADDFDSWYHLGLAYYLAGNFNAAVEAYYQCGAAAKTPDDQVAVGHWIYMALRRLGDSEQAKKILAQIPDDIEVRDNVAYRELLLFYKGKRDADSLLAEGKDEPLNAASYGYAVANWHLYNGRKEEARALFDEVLKSPYWPAFGYIASEVEKARDKE